MAIKINNVTVIDDSKNLYITDIAFSDATIASTAVGAGGNNTEFLGDDTVKISNVLNTNIQLLREIDGDAATKLRNMLVP